MFMLDDDMKPVKVRNDEFGPKPKHSIFASLYCVPVFLMSLVFIGFQLLIILSLFSKSSGGAGPIGLGYGIGIALSFSIAHAVLWVVGCGLANSSVVGAKAYVSAGITSLAIPALIALVILL